MRDSFTVVTLADALRILDIQPCKSEAAENAIHTRTHRWKRQIFILVFGVRHVG